jgi:type I restriction enzyme M protein
MEPSDYKHVALGLIFLKHISDGFEMKRQALLAEYPRGAEDPDEYLADNIFWVPPEARWSHLQANAKQPTIGKLIDEAMIAIEKVNPTLKGVLPKDYGRPALNAVMLGELIDLISGIALGEGKDKARDLLGRVYEYFLGQFAGSEGKRGGEFYTPRSVVAPWSRCWSPTRAASMTPAAARAACSCSRRSSSRRTAAVWATSPSTGRSRTTPPGGCAR